MTDSGSHPALGERSFHGLLEKGSDFLSIHDGSSNTQKIDDKFIYEAYEGDKENFLQVNELTSVDEYILTLFGESVGDLLDLGFEEQAKFIESKLESAKRNFEKKELSVDWSFYRHLILEFETKANSPELSKFANFIFLKVVEKLVLVRKLNNKEQEVLIDDLTGIGNPRAYKERFHSLLEGGRRKEDAELTLIYIDLDHFKEVNDQHNHLVGDFVLKEFASLVRNLIRSEDGFYRKGGEEFAILLTAPKEVARRIMEKIRSSVGELTLDLSKFGYEQDFKFTVSIGSVSLSDIDETKDLNVDREKMEKLADACLYTVKENGRNNVFQYGVDNKDVFEQSGFDIKKIISELFTGLSSDFMKNYPNLVRALARIKQKRSAK